MLTQERLLNELELLDLRHRAERGMADSGTATMEVKCRQVFELVTAVEALKERVETLEAEDEYANCQCEMCVYGRE